MTDEELQAAKQVYPVVYELNAIRPGDELLCWGWDGWPEVVNGETWVTVLAVFDGNEAGFNVMPPRNGPVTGYRHHFCAWRRSK